MKKEIFATVLFISSMTVLSQSDVAVSGKRLKYGINLGVNYSNLLGKEMLSNNALLSNRLGFSLGILADYRISKFLSISPKTEMSFNESVVDFTNIDGSQTQYEIMPISLDFMAHVIFKKNNGKLNPYFFFGPNVKIPVSIRDDNSSNYSTDSDFAIDFGIGVDKPFTHFNFSPEIRYSWGLLNINRHPSIQSLYYHNISLVFNFLGK